MLSRINNEKQWKDLIRPFSTEPMQKGHDGIVKELRELVADAVRRNIPEERFGILFSGGVDSTLLAKLCKDNGADFICYTSALAEKGMKEAEDLSYARKAAKEFGLRLRIKTVSLDETELYIKEVLGIIGKPDVVKVGVALPFHIAFKVAKQDKVKVMFSGLGPEELFAGYERHKQAGNVNKECFDGLLNMYGRDIERDSAVAGFHKIDLRAPYLDREVIEYSLRIPAELKLNSKGNKVILREAAEQLGLGRFAWRKKRAAQYGSRFDRAIQRLSKRNGFKYKKDYLNHLLKLLK
ncbi:asparagine synthase C-terminal domain-containing protein [Candidatus Woesearchaeota archaeon]|nr:asparagine synthase C-terminal domain-containing protein [Candidatus Woesearchaeota archaeon]